MDKNENKVVARGRILGIGRDDYGHKRLILCIRGREDHRLVYLSFAFATALPLDVSVHSYVKIEGHIVGKSYRNEIWGRQSYMQYFVAEKIEKDRTQLEEAFPELCVGKGFAYPNSEVKVALSGEVVRISRSGLSQDKIKPDRVWTRLMIRCVSNDESPNMINVQYSSNMRASDVEVHHGDKVCLTAIVSSKRKPAENGRTTRSFEDIIVNDIVVVEPAPVKEEEPAKQEEPSESSKNYIPADNEENEFFDDKNN